jgi:hypothetical protein
MEADGKTKNHHFDLGDFLLSIIFLNTCKNCILLYGLYRIERQIYGNTINK